MFSCSALPNPTRVLIVEDEHIIAMATSASLRRMGCEVVGTASTGQQAIDYAADRKPDVVLMDIMLQGTMNGIEAARQIRYAAPHLPIIYCTAYTDAGTRAQAAQANPRAFMGKPLDYAVLKNLIDELE
ncbi:MAG: response regulator [Proteobacteria bacterium]|nr:response regulator [Pseudomonadota bacterium]MBU1596553.1 response regulator [Pseudomonadota bacterium]